MRTNFIIGLMAIAFFSYSQYQGWGLFDKEASTRSSLYSPGRTSHK